MVLDFSSHCWKKSAKEMLNYMYIKPSYDKNKMNKYLPVNQNDLKVRKNLDSKEIIDCNIEIRSKENNY